MAKVTKKKKSGKKNMENLELLYPESAGIDVSATEMQVCVPPSMADGEHNRTFGTTTGELEALVAWLRKVGIVHVAMEATGVYWIPLFLMLCHDGMKPVLLNAADVKNFTARKTDVNDAEWLRIIEAMIRGERDSVRLAALAGNGCKKSKEEIAAALNGVWSDSLIFIMSQNYDQYKLLRGQISALDGHMECRLHSMMGEVLVRNDGEMKEVVRSGKKPKRASNRISFDLEALATQIWRVNLMRIDGVSAVTVMMLLGELGTDFTDKFKSAAHFCSWCNLSPNDKVSGGRLLSSRRKKRGSIVGNILRNCAQSVAKSKSPMGDFYRRMRMRGGGKYAIVATAHKIATIIYTMVKKGTEYDKTKVTISDTEWLKKSICKQKSLLNKLENQLIEQAG